MSRVVFVKNVLLHGQNGKKSKKMRVFGIFKSDPRGCFWIPIKNLTTFEFLLIDAKFCPLYFTIGRLFTKYGPFSSYKRKNREISVFLDTKSCPPHFRGCKLRFGIRTPYQTILEKNLFPQLI